MAHTVFAYFIWVFFLACAVVPGVIKKSWPVVFIGVTVTIFGVIVPLFDVIFFHSFAGGPWVNPGDCVPWWQCFNNGVKARIPLVSWATAALYILEVWRPVKVSS